MPLQKPAPLMIDGKAYYTLTSYDPVSITVNVPLVSDADVEFALEALVAQAGLKPSDLDDPAFIEKNFEGCSTRQDVADFARAQLEQANQQAAEDEKPSLVAAELASRLGQSVPADEVARVRRGLEAQLQDQVSQQGGSWAQFLKEAGGEIAVDQMLKEQAAQVAEQDAALAAYAQHAHLTVERNEIPRLLGIPLEHAQEFLDQVEASGHMDDFKEGALRAKAISAAVAQCSCTYRHETPEEAAKRVEAYRELRAQMTQGQDAGDADEPQEGQDPQGPHDDGPRLKLV